MPWLMLYLFYDGNFNGSIRKLIIFKLLGVVMQGNLAQDPVVIGYFGIRAKAQVCRLLCEYLGVCYRDLHFTPDEWEEYQQTEAKDWVIKALPFLKDGGFVVTGQQGMIEYIVRRANHPLLLGSTARDRIRLDAFKSKYEVKDNIIALICQLNRSSGKESPLRPPHFYWEKNIYPKLQELEAATTGREWFLGYLSVADFALYEMMNNLLWLFPEIGGKLPNLAALQGRVRALERVQAYEQSQRAVKVFNPICFYREFEQRVEGLFGKTVQTG